MTTIEMAAITGFVGAIFGAGSAYGLNRGTIKNHTALLLALERRIADHEKSPSPHAACPAHDATLQAILRHLADIKADLTTIAEHVWAIGGEMTDSTLKTKK